MAGTSSNPSPPIVLFKEPHAPDRTDLARDDGCSACRGVRPLPRGNGPPGIPRDPWESGRVPPPTRPRGPRGVPHADVGGLLRGDPTVRGPRPREGRVLSEGPGFPPLALAHRGALRDRRGPV